MFGRTDFSGDMASFTMPTLLIHGTDDKIVPLKATSEAAALHIPGSTLIKYEGAPHGLFITHKEDLLRDIADFAGSQSHLEHLNPHRNPIAGGFDPISQMPDL